MDISLKFVSLYKIIITSSKLKDNLVRSGKGLITSLGLKIKARPKKCKKSRYAIKKISKNNLSKIIKEFDKLPYKGYKRKRTKHEPPDSYFYPAIQLAKCMIRADALNSHVYPVITEMTAKKWILIYQVCSMYKSELEEFLVNENLS